MEMEKMIELIDAVSKSDLTGFKYERLCNRHISSCVEPC